ncbi:MAG: hypothetical protein AAF171_20330 [Cyanobacteria bacterium P01_A01_bin.116]
MSDPVLSQLVSVEDDLAQQAELLETKLTQLREQRQGLQTVIDMFQGSGSKPPAAATKRKAPGRKPAAKTTKAKTTQTKASKTKTAAKSKTAATKTKTSKKTGRLKKKDGRAANWQKYVQSTYRDAALPEAVSSVLRAQPSEIFTIADVMSSIFKEDMPRTSFLKARNRISNILSAGARDGTWYRGRNGRYSQSESVTKL